MLVCIYAAMEGTGSDSSVDAIVRRSLIGTVFDTEKSPADSTPRSSRTMPVPDYMSSRSSSSVELPSESPPSYSAVMDPTSEFHMAVEGGASGVATATRKILTL